MAKNTTQKIAVSDLKPGMFVEELDQAWLDTDFEFQGILLQGDEDIERVRKFCKHVYISRSGVPDDAADSAAPGQNSDRSLRSNRPSSFREEIGRARIVRDQASVLVDTIHDDIMAGNAVNTDGAREVVTQMTDSVSRHPEALVWFANLKSRDKYTALHSLNVCMLAITIASALGEGADAIEEMGVGALLHDVGKLKVPLEILNKPGKLTDAEFAEMKRHPEYGVAILRETRDISSESLDIVLSHHERLNGAGYPRGLAGDQVSYYSQIVAIADVYDAMTSDRVYHKGRSPAEVFKIMLNEQGVFNQEILREFAHSLGDYPSGSVVELNTGEVGLVIPDGERKKEPTVLIVLDHRKRRYFPQRVRDLSRFPNFKVAAVLAPGSYGVDVSDYAEQLD